MAEPLQHLYDLALRALEEQERQAAELRGRLTPVLAASGLAATLLLPAAFAGSRPHGAVEILLTAVGLLGVAVTMGAATFLLSPWRLTFVIEAQALVSQSAEAPVERFLAGMVGLLDERRIDNARSISRLRVALTIMLCGLHVSVCGLALAVAVA